MASSVVNSDPKFINYLLDPKEKYEFYYIVGNGKNNTPVERIGIVKKMLIAHSEVFKRELEDVKWKEKNNTKISDVFPSTFKNMLRYMYGYDNTASLTFEDADDLLYAADKYMMDELKDILASRLMEMLSPDNVCSLMNNPAVYRVLELNNEITKIIQFETSKVLTSPKFLGLCEDAFLKILEQEKLKTEEIELWRSAVKWAKNRTNSEDGQTLRKELTKHVRHIRVCTVPMEDFCRDVVPTEILSNEEVVQIVKYHGNKEVKPDLKEICSIVKPRTNATMSRTVMYEKSDVISEILLSYFLDDCSVKTESSIEVSTGASRLELCALGVWLDIFSQYDFTVTVENINNPADSTTIEKTVHVARGVGWQYPSITFDDDSVHLLPNSRYRVVLRSAHSHLVRHCHDYTDQPVSSYSGSHFTVNFTPCDTHHGEYSSSVDCIKYKTMKSK